MKRYNPQASSLRPQVSDRRGVLLLVVLSLLVLFALIGVTFVLVAGQHYRSLKMELRGEQYGDDPRKLCDAAMAQIVRGTADSFSAMDTQSLLDDMYGPDSFGGPVTSASAVAGTNGQFLDIVVGVDRYSPLHSTTISDLPGYYNGCVFTVLSRTLGNISTRIIGYTPGAAMLPVTSGTFRVMALQGTAALPTNLDRFLVNGRPFTGAGYGFNPTTGLLDFPSPGNPFVLLPNTDWEIYSWGPNATDQNGGGDDLRLPVVVPNEEYDAPDLQNMFLAFVPANPTIGPPSTSTIIPSMHRPALIQFHTNNMSLPNWYDLPIRTLRQIMFRPIGEMAGATGSGVHPAFTGSNSNFDPINGPWDVDNDADGIPDSVWIDIGLPVRTAPDGRTYKPLVAPLIVDLDGRLNVNAHGSLGEFDTVTTNGPFAGNPALSSPADLSRGAGYGPADVSLAPLFPPASSLYQNLLRGDATNSIVGRYGTPLTTAVPGLDSASNLYDQLAYVKLFDLPRPVVTLRHPYANVPDLWARGLLGLDYRGQPLRYGVGPASYPNDSVDHPYELNLGSRAPRGIQNVTGMDGLFSAAELERILRRYDVDATALPDRLRALMDGIPPSNTVAYQNLITTDSYDLPVPSFRPTRDMILGPDDLPDSTIDGIGKLIGATNLSIMDLLRYRLVKAGVTNDSATLTPLMNQLLSPELVAGLRIDINRPLGNGRDDTAAGTGGENVVDEPDEARSPELLWNDNAAPTSDPTAIPPTGFPGVPFRHNNWELDFDGIAGVNAADDLYDRELLARHLYILMMLLKDEKTQIDFNNDGFSLTPADDVETAYAVAQWAINVVDFRDADSIMTPFEFPLNPFKASGWTAVDNNPLTDEGPAVRGLVWGCERPELVMTETLAFHDRRTEDLATDKDAVGTIQMNHDTGNGDGDFDQRLVPRGALFVELYNPWTAVEQLPAELYYDVGTSSWSPGILLNKVTPPTSLAPGVTSPVWRLAVVAGVGDLNDPTTPATAERTVYFTSSAPGYSMGEFYTSLPVQPIQPGQYGVVGPGEPVLTQQGDDVHRIPIGRKTGDSDNNPYNPALGGTRHISLDPTGASPNGAKVKNNTAPGSTEPTPGETKVSVGIVIDAPQSLSVTVPLAGYPAPDPPPAGKEAVYREAWDTPFDTAPELKATGTTVEYRWLHLQRLANPLLPWNPEFGQPGHNPALPLNLYMTIDVMPIDLTAFNGVANDGGAGTVMFASRQRGERNDPSTPANLWRREPLGKPVAASPPEAPATHQFAFILQHSLGYLNPWLAAPFGSASVPASNGYLGDPQTPFPWLTWNNRPFASAAELLLVPRNRSSRMTNEFGTAVVAGNPYTNPLSSFSHTLNLFQSSITPGSAPEFHRLTDYVHVPSRFVGTETVLNPAAAYFGTTSYTTAAIGFHPPFNRVPTFREPGKVNINTMPGDLVWSGILSGLSGPPWNAIEASRRGTAPVPSEFANPFRASTGGPAYLPSYLPTPVPIRDVDVSLLRADIPNTGTNLLLKPTAASAYNDSNRNAYFHYQLQQRLGNAVTTRSNVYAIWVTVGYFEVSPSPRHLLFGSSGPVYQIGVPSPVYPDGYQLGQEVGADTGEVKRHRAFYIFDRSIPVGFEPGVDHNYEDGLLLKRFIE